MKHNKKLIKLIIGWLVGTIGILLISLAILFGGVMIGVGSGYDNPYSTFDFGPYAITFIVLSGLNVLYNIIMIMIIIIKSTRK